MKLQKNKNLIFLLSTFFLNLISFFIIFFALSKNNYHYIIVYLVGVLVGYFIEYFGSKTKLWVFYNKKTPPVIVIFQWGALLTIMEFIIKLIGI